MRTAIWMVSAAVLVGAGVGLNRAVNAQEAGKKAPPNIVGVWTGEWQDYKPAPPAKLAPAQPGDKPAEKKGGKSLYPAMDLQCTVTATGDGKYEAVFEGECGRPYKYKIKMQGREVGSAVLFSGTVDLGPMDGGVYDWIGKANGKEFIGFYTSQGHTGNFSLGRPAPTTAPAPK